MDVFAELILNLTAHENSKIYGKFFYLSVKS